MSVFNRPLALLPVVMLAATTLACLVPGATPTATVVPTVAASPTDVPATEEPTVEVPTAEVTAAVSGDARDELIAALEATKTGGPYHVVSTLQTGSTTVSEHGDVILPDKFHVFATINTTPEREYLIIGSDTWVGAGGQLAHTTADVSSIIEGFINTLDPDKISDVVLVGIEDLSGTQAKHFKFTYTNSLGGVDILSTIDMWVGVDNHLPIKQVIDGTANGSAYHAQQDINYDPSITIEAP